MEYIEENGGGIFKQESFESNLDKLSNKQLIQSLVDALNRNQQRKLGHKNTSQLTESELSSSENNLPISMPMPKKKVKKTTEFEFPPKRV